MGYGSVSLAAPGDMRTYTDINVAILRDSTVGSSARVGAAEPSTEESHGPQTPVPAMGTLQGRPEREKTASVGVYEADSERLESVRRIVEADEFYTGGVVSRGSTSKR